MDRRGAAQRAGRLAALRFGRRGLYCLQFYYARGVHGHRTAVTQTLALWWLSKEWRAWLTRRAKEACERVPAIA